MEITLPVIRKDGPSQSGVHSDAVIGAVRPFRVTGLVKPRCGECGEKHAAGVPCFKRAEHDVSQEGPADQPADTAPYTIVVNNPIVIAKAGIWESDLHPRGQPNNAGEFGPGGSSAPKTTTSSPSSLLTPTSNVSARSTLPSITQSLPHLTDTSALTGKDYPKSKEGKRLSPITRARAKKNLQNYFIKGQAAPSYAEDRDWYQTRHNEMSGWAQAAGVDVSTYVGAIASTSPLCPWVSKNGILMNKNLADKTIALAKSNPDVDPKAFVKDLKSPGMLKTSLIHAMQVVQGDLDGALTGPKIRSFFNNIVNPWGDDVTMDTWMARALAADPDLMDEKGIKAYVGGGSQSKPDQAKYSWGADIVREIAKENGLTPNQAQAVIWTQVKRETTLSGAG